MASYKVPQDVEAEDKLLGPFSFRQFIYLVIASLAAGLAYLLFNILAPLALIPVPIIIIFLALALPLKKDQPMEVYFAAILAFYFKPRRKLWQTDSITNLVEITDQITDPRDQTPVDISFDEAKDRISFLSKVVDSRGMIIKNQFQNSSLQADIISEVNQIQDIHDINTGVGQNFNQMLSDQSSQNRQRIINQLNQPTTSQNSAYPNFQTWQQTRTTETQPIITDYPTPEPVVNTQKTTSQNQLDNELVNLASNTDLSVQTIAAQAKKITNKNILGDQDEIIISMR